MPMYYFCLANDGDFLRDPEGAFLIDDGMALRAAADVVTEFRTKAGDERESSDWRLEIYEEGGRKVGTLPL